MSVSSSLVKSRDEIAEAYATPPWWYDLRGFCILTFAYNSTLPHQVRFFASNVGANHLEVACGTGTLLQIVMRWRALKGLQMGRVVGIDYAQRMLDGARRRFRRWPQVHLEHADAASLPYADASFDTVNIANAVHCMPAPGAALREAFRVLTPGGTLAVNVLLYPRGAWPWRTIAARIDAWGVRKGILFRPYERAEVRSLIRSAGFSVEAERIRGNCYDVVARKPFVDPGPRSTSSRARTVIVDGTSSLSRAKIFRSGTA